MPHIVVLRAARNGRRARYRAVNLKRANAHTGMAGSERSGDGGDDECCCYEVADAVLPVF